MLVVIFGAGASFDSVNTRVTTGLEMKYRPPLAKELFDSRDTFSQVIDQYPQIRPIASNLRRSMAAGKDFEQTLEKIQERYPESVEIKRQLGALRFYLREIIRISSNEWFSQARGVTNYTELFSELENWRRINNERIVYVTFNYDNLTERSLGEVLNRPFGGLNDYINDEKTLLIKPHGSINWTQISQLYNVTAYDHSQTYVINRFEHLRFTGEMAFVGDGFDIDADDGYINIPAIAIPMNRKSEFICPENHLNVLWDCLRTADRIMTVGWRANEEHFKKSWRNLVLTQLPVKTLVCSNTKEGAQVTIENLKSAGIASDFTIAEGGFSELLGTEVFDRFLSD